MCVPRWHPSGASEDAGGILRTPRYPQDAIGILRIRYPQDTTGILRIPRFPQDTAGILYGILRIRCVPGHRGILWTPYPEDTPACPGTRCPQDTAPCRLLGISRYPQDAPRVPRDASQLAFSHFRRRSAHGRLTFCRACVVCLGRAHRGTFRILNIISIPTHPRHPRHPRHTPHTPYRPCTSARLEPSP